MVNDPGTYSQIDTLDSLAVLVATDYNGRILILSGSVRDLSTGAGNDIAFGSFWDDTVDAGRGNDVIAGMAGDDQITTGTGRNMIFADRVSSSGPIVGDGHDVIADFDVTSDRLIVEYDSDVETYVPWADLTETSAGVLLSYAAGSSVLLAGVTLAELSGMNLMAMPKDITYMQGGGPRRNPDRIRATFATPLPSHTSVDKRVGGVVAEWSKAHPC